MIVSGSMEPAIPTGSVVYDEVVPVEDLEVGDVITFVPPPEYGIAEPVTHRIVEIGRTPPAARPPASSRSAPRATPTIIPTRGRWRSTQTSRPG